MSTKTRNMMREVMQLMWQFIRQNGLPQSEALKTAWRNVKLRKAMAQRIVKFVFQSGTAQGNDRAHRQVRFPEGR